LGGGFGPLEGCASTHMRQTCEEEAQPAELWWI
jgi:hypothetical protein